MNVFRDSGNDMVGMVLRHVVPLNSFASVRGHKHSVMEGKTAGTSIEQARKLFRALDISSPVVLSDRAVPGVLAYAGARVGAVAKLGISDHRNMGEPPSLRFREKGGKDRETPGRSDLEGWINAWITAAGIAEGYFTQ